MEKGKVVHITDLAQLKKLVNEHQAVVVDFFATWCGPCKLLGPKLEALAKVHENVCVVKVDVDEAAEISEFYSISSMPTVMGFSSGKTIETVIGFNEKKITDLMQKLSGFYKFFFIFDSIKYFFKLKKLSINQSNELIFYSSNIKFKNKLWALNQEMKIPLHHLIVEMLFQQMNIIQEKI